MQAQRLQRTSGESGMAIVLVLFMSIMLSGLCLGLLQEGMAAKTSLAHHTGSMRALEVAETGLVRAEQELRSLTDFAADGVGSASGTIGGGSFDVQAVSDPISPDRWILNAEGTYGLNVRRIEVLVRRRRNSFFADALFSEDDLVVSSVVTDAYDSRLGTYASQATNSDAAGAFADTGGSLGSNADIHVDGSSIMVRGNAIPGPLRDVLESGSPTITGDKAPRELAFSFDPVDHATFLNAMNNNNNASLQGGPHGNTFRYNANTQSVDITGNSNVTLAGGTYFFKDFSMRGGSALTITGPVKIYVTDSFDIGADADIFANAPSDVQIFAHPYQMPGSSVGTPTQVKVAGGSNVTWSLYGPGADLDIGGGNHFYGAAAAKHIELNGSNAFHYDKALGAFGKKGTPYIERLYWKETPLPRP